MYRSRYGDARGNHVGILILIIAGTCLAADGRQYKQSKDRPRSAEQSSDEGPVPFSAEFGEFFEGGGPKESGEGFFPDDFEPGPFPYSDSKNTTKYVNPATSYHSVKDMPGHNGREHARSYKEEPSGSSGGYRGKDQPYRKDYRDSASYRKDSHKDDPSYRVKEERGRKGDVDSYHKDRAYRKSDSFRKEDSYRSKDGPQYRGGSSDPSYRKESSSYRNRDGYKKDDDRPSYRSRSSDSRYRKDGPSYRSEESTYRKDDPDDRSYRNKKPIQSMYDDWSPEDDKGSYRDRDRGEPELSSEYDDPDYRERDDSSPPPSSSSRYNDKEPRSKSIPTSMRPGPPYYSTPSRRPPESHQRTHTTSFGVRHEYPPPPTPQTYYAPSTSQRKHDTSRDFHHRKGEPASSKSRADTEWTEFRPSPPDPLVSRSRSRDDYPQSEFSNPVPKKVVTTTQKPLHRQNCIKLKKTSSPETSSGKFVKKVATCYVCVDEKTGMNYEECSYETDSKTRPFLKTAGEDEAQRSLISHRDKRDVSVVEEQTDDKTEKETDRAKREKDYYDSSREDADPYKLDGFDEGESDKDASESDEEDSSSENCYKKRKGEMSCIVCQTPNKKGSYEQCSYASDPSKNKYEHSVEKVYGSPRLPESNKKYNKKGAYGSKEDDYDGDYPEGADYDAPGDESSGKKNNERKPFGEFGGFGGFGDGFESVFGDLSGEGFDFDSIPEPAENEGQFSTKDETFNFKPDDMEDIDMTKNIGDFGQKNRSNCKKVMKNKMTCYQCVTTKGTKNEECMYVAAAEPKSKHLSFSQVQEYRFDPHNSTSKSQVPVVESTNDGKRKFKKYHPDLVNIKYFSKMKDKPTMDPSRWPRSPGKKHNGTLKNSTTANSTTSRRKDDLTGEASDTRQTQAAPAVEEEPEEEPPADEEEEEEGSEEEAVEEEYRAIPTEPTELDLREAEKGEFHGDTQPAWDPKLGISLPRYMLERSEHEAIFDEVLASG